VSSVVEHQIAWDLDVFYLIGGDYPEGMPGAWVTAGFMQGLGIRPAMGRAFTEDEFRPGTAQVALISHTLWRQRFAGDSNVVGRTFEAYVSDRPDDPDLFTIVGVLPETFWHINTYTNVFTPLKARTYPYLVRLRPGVDVRLASERITELVRSGGVAPSPDWRAELRSVQSVYAARVKPLLLAVGASVSLVLLIAAANVAFLALLRGMHRQREIAVRQALGADNTRLARLLLAEALLLAGSGVALGTFLGAALLSRLGPLIERHLGRQSPGGTASLAMAAAFRCAPARAGRLNRWRACRPGAFFSPHTGDRRLTGSGIERRPDGGYRQANAGR
jgi:hypothetical protein